ncbi:MAG: hypothetical protein AB7P37_11950 [Ramlibacter sp.]
MNQPHTTLTNPRTTPCLSRAALAVGLLACLTGGSAWAYDSGSTGADGVLNPAVSTEIVLPPNGVLQYTSVNIPVGVTVTFKKNALNTPVQMIVSGNVTIAGTIDVKGQDSPPVGSAGNGNQADDGLPGLGGPGGFDGGRGGRSDSTGSATSTMGGAGQGPGGGRGGRWPNTANGSSGDPYREIGGSARFNSFDHTATDASLYGNGPGAVYGTEALQPLIGGSGGGGGGGGLSFEGSGGGGGGGAILIAASGTITVTGSIFAYGGSSGQPAGTGAGSYGGGGSGGAIRLIATTLAGNGTINASYGCQYYNTANGTTNCNSHRHQGGRGRIRFEAETLTFNGTVRPVASVGVPGPITIPNAPSIRIASIGGSSVPATPTGNADVTLPANITNPVTVNFETANVPTGNTIKLRVVPAYGDSVEVLSPAITGTAASGATSVSVNLPQGPSVLQAITSFTVTVAQAEALQHFAQNERVEKVELIAAVGGATRAELVTASGKRFAVPLTVLQMAGVTG